MVIICICGLRILHNHRPAVAPATIVTPFEFLRLPFTTFVGVLLYGEALEWPVFIGAFVVLAANILNIRAETQARPVP